MPLSKTALVIGAGRNQLPLIKKCAELGLTTIAVDGNPEAPGRLFCDRFFHADVKDHKSIIRLLADTDLDAVISSAEAGVLAAAAISDYYQLPGIPVKSSKMLLDKERMREHMRDLGLRTPRFVAVSCMDEARAYLDRIVFPAIIKPVDSYGSKGVLRVGTREEIIKNFGYTLSMSVSGRVLIEEFIEGEEISAEGILHDGVLHLVAFTGKKRTSPPNRLDMGIFIGADIGDGLKREIEWLLGRYLEPLGISSACVHAEFILGENGPVIVEVAGRMGGGRIPSDLVPLAYGIDMIKAAINVSLGVKPELERTRDNGAALFWLQAPPGIIKEIRGVKRAASMEGVVELATSLMPGDKVEEMRSSTERDMMGHVIAIGSDGKEAAARAIKAVEAVEIITE